MFRSVRSSRWTRATIAATVGVALLIGGAQFTAHANDDDDALPDVKFLRGLLKGLGLRSDRDGGIEYRERSPLVLPPGRELPAPANNAAPTQAANWPKDPDIERAKQARTDRRKPNPEPEELARTLTPDELNLPRGRAPGRRGSRAGEAPGPTIEDVERPLSPTELGAKSPFSSIWASKNETKPFVREPERDALTQPPTGYRTPSPSQPYGVGPEKWTDKPQERHIQPR